MDLAHDRQRDFICEHAADPDVLPPLRTTGLRRPNGTPIDVTAAGVIRAIHTPFFDQVHPVTRRKVYEFYAYDWRLDLRYNGARLWEMLQGSGRSEPWDIACHSQGGLLVLWASIVAGPVEFRKFVRRVVFFGVPLQGSVNAVQALVNGFSLVPGLDLDAAVVRTWPSVYMMMPRWRLRVPGATRVEAFKASTWSSANLLAADGDLQKGISPDLLERARAWKKEMDSQSFEAMRGIERLVVVQGDNLNTLARTPKFPAMPDLEGRRDGEVIVRGDGLVPMDLTLRLVPRELGAMLESVASAVNSHDLMVADQDQANLCERIFA